MDGDVLSLLANLQSVADEIDRLEAKRRAATEERDRVQVNVDTASRTLSEKEESRHALDIERRKREMSVKADKERMQRLKSRLAEVKTSREYQAAITEISGAKQVISDQEELILKDMEALEKLDAELEDLRGRIEGMKSDLEGAASELERVLAETEHVVADRQKEEATILKTLPIEVVDRYRLIRTRRGGLAVVEAKDEACTACFMRIPPQMYIEVIKRTRVIQCPNCHRILIPPRVENEPGEEGAGGGRGRFDDD